MKVTIVNAVSVKAHKMNASYDFQMNSRDVNRKRRWMDIKQQRIISEIL